MSPFRAPVPFATALTFILTFTLAACSSEESRGTGADELVDGAAPGESEASVPDETEGSVPEDEIVFASDPYTLEPTEEKYMCWAGNLPDDRNVVVREISGDYGPGTHHVFFAWTLAPEPEGMSECPVLFKLTWIPIYLGGVNTSPLTVPEGAGIDLERGKQLVLQLHMQNTTAEPIVNQVTMHMKLVEPESDFVPAGIFGLDNHAIDVPPLSEGTDTSMTCTPGKQMEVFSILGHMHKLGRSYEVFKGGQSVFNQDWNFDEQPITPFEMSVGPEDDLGLRCTHHNPYDFPITYGESSDNEMCATVFYYTPYDRLGGCINFPPADGADGGVGDGG